MYTPYPCFICDKPIAYLEEKYLSNLSNGIEIVFEGSYGSIHDLDSFRAYICDECVQTKLNENKIQFIYNRLEIKD